MAESQVDAMDSLEAELEKVNISGPSSDEELLVN
jgi:hypothetical protein